MSGRAGLLGARHPARSRENSLRPAAPASRPPSCSGSMATSSCKRVATLQTQMRSAARVFAGAQAARGSLLVRWCGAPGYARPAARAEAPHPARRSPTSYARSELPLGGHPCLPARARSTAANRYLAPRPRLREWAGAGRIHQAGRVLGYCYTHPAHARAQLARGERCARGVSPVAAPPQSGAAPSPGGASRGRAVADAWPGRQLGTPSGATL
jgi:hypothetical protein